MRELLINTMAPVLWVITVFDGVAIWFMIAEFRKNGVDKIPLLTGILCIGLFYDSLILASGCFLEYGTLFHHLSQLRYILHCTLIPLLFPICAYTMTDNKKIIRIVWFVSIVIMILGLAGGLMVVTEPRTVGAIRRYASSDLTGKFSNTLTSMLDTVPVFIMIGIGIYFWIKKKNPNMFFAGFFMLLFTLLGIFLGRDPSGDRSMSLMFYISMFGEALMVFFLWRFIRKKQ
ncbi:MAG: hypothetical protein IJI05_03585 [Erysipelotrichaceae bacterium]|nr:hypothetical protein [Erysipelotrichaceae bacterium]